MVEKVLKVNTGEDAVLHKEVTQEGLEVIQKVPKIQIEILVYSTEENAKRMNKMLGELQKQLDSSRRAKNRVRVFYTIDKGDTTPEQKKQWLIERANCVYYVFAPENHEIPSTYIRSLLDNVKKFEEAIKFFKKTGIIIARKKQEITAEVQKIEE
jgi:hypothetical protein